jgi:hypothetical protein
MLVAVVFKVSKNIYKSVRIKKVLDVLRRIKTGQAYKEHLIA